MKKNYGKYVIHQAAMEGKLKLIKYFHKKGFALNKMDIDGETPILLAAIKGFWNIVYYLHEKIGIQKKNAKSYHNAFLHLLRI